MRVSRTCLNDRVAMACHFSLWQRCTWWRGVAKSDIAWRPVNQISRFAGSVFYFFRCPDKSKVQLALDEAVREHMAQDTLLRESLAACPREKLFWIWIVGDDCFRYFLTLTSHQDADPNSTSQSSLILHDSTMFCSFFGLSSGHQWSPLKLVMIFITGLSTAK